MICFIWGREKIIKLKNSGTDKAAIYEALYKIEAAEALDPYSKLPEAEKTAVLEKAYVNLQEGRAQFPDDISILFAEIVPAVISSAFNSPRRVIVPADWSQNIYLLAAALPT